MYALEDSLGVEHSTFVYALNKSSRSRGYKTFIMHNSTETEISIAHKNLNAKN